MKKLTTILMVVAFATFSFQSFAQTFGVKAGLNMSKMAAKMAGKSIDNDMLLGFHVGATAELELMENVSAEVGLLLSTKGYKNESTAGSITTTTKSNPMYIEIPINAKYSYDIGSAKLYFAAGPYLAFGIGGKDKTEVSGGTVSAGGDTDIKWGDKAGEMKRFDAGINIGAGAEFGAMGVGIQYGLGLMNTWSKGDDKNYAKNRVIGISVSYKFAK